MMIFNAGMVTTLQKMHLFRLYKLRMKVGQFLVSYTFTSRTVKKIWKYARNL